MKKVTKKPVKKSVKSVKPAVPVVPVVAKPTNAVKLASFIAGALPWAKATGKISDLRKILPDHASEGKAVRIWWGGKQVLDTTILRVTQALVATNISDPLDVETAKRCTDLLKAAQKANVNPMTVSLLMDAYIPTMTIEPQYEAPKAIATTPAAVEPTPAVVEPTPYEKMQEQLS